MREDLYEFERERRGSGGGGAKSFLSHRRGSTDPIRNHPLADNTTIEDMLAPPVATRDY